jgi:hypothetical protein
MKIKILSEMHMMRSFNILVTASLRRGRDEEKPKKFNSGTVTKTGK